MQSPRLLCMCALVGWALPLGCYGASSDESPSTATGGSSGGARTTAGSGGTGAVVAQNPCPESAPSDGSSCEEVGRRCGYDDASVTYLCTSELEWREREYVPQEEASGGGAGAGGAAGAGGESGAGPETIVQPETIFCPAFSVAECPQTGQCIVGCGGSAPGAGSGQGCAAACNDRYCGELPAEQCPDRCSLYVACDGNTVCGPLRSAPPACGVVSYYGQDVACCEGLVPRCGAPDVDGVCVATAGYWMGSSSVPQCIACGDGTCESTIENVCNCPEDCG